MAQFGNGACFLQKALPQFGASREVWRDDLAGAIVTGRCTIRAPLSSRPMLQLFNSSHRNTAAPLWFRVPARLTFVALLATLNACGTSSPPKSGTDSTTLSAAGSAAVRDSVKAVLKDFTNRMSTKDFDGAGKLYSDDSSFSWIENGSLSFRSAKDVRSSLQSLRSIPEIKLAYYETQIEVLAPKVATVRTEFSQTFVDRPGRGTTYGGFLTMTVVREAAGWRILNGHTSSRKPRPGL